MADELHRPRTLKEIVEESQYWDAEDLLHNLDAEIDRIERGIGHMVWNLEDRPVTRCLHLLPVTPRFKVSEAGDKFAVKITLPRVPEDKIKVKVDGQGVEVFACTSDPVCRPYYVNIESRTPLDPDTTRLRHVEGSLEVEVTKAKQKRVNIR